MPQKSAYAEQATAELREIMRHAGALLDATADEADDRVQNARHKLEERLSVAKDKFAEAEGLLDETVQHADRLVREKPYHAVGGSFLLGLFLGWFMSRK